MTTDPRTIAERIASRLDSATYEMGKERETQVRIIEAEIAAIFRMAEAIQDWIPCAERLPERFETAILYLPDTVEVGYLTSDAVSFMLLPLGCLTKEVTHWQPLPKPPEVRT